MYRLIDSAERRKLIVRLVRMRTVCGDAAEKLDQFRIEHVPTLCDMSLVSEVCIFTSLDFERHSFALHNGGNAMYRLIDSID